jgi:type II secretory pathway pseudopilin PulG
MNALRGFSTLELLIAMAIMISTLTTVLLASFGNQSLLEQAGIRAEALQRAQGLLEAEQGNARRDFRLVTGIATTSEGIYRSSLAVGDVPADPYTTKRVTATVGWDDESHTPRSISLTALLTDFQDPSTLDTCDSALSGSWKAPSFQNYVVAAGDLLPASAPSGHTFSATNPIGSIDAYRQRLYLGVSKKAAAANDSLFVFDTSDPTKRPRYLGSIDNNASVTEGVTALIAAGSFAYVANSHVSNFKTCKPSANCSQLQLFKVSDPSAIPAPVNFLLPTSSAPYVTGTSTSQALGNSIFYQDGYVYLGLSKTATGPEFNIIDVHDPNNPKWIGGYQVGWSINQIYVRDGYAYLATDDKSRELIILDVADPKTPTAVSTFDPTGTLGYEVGKSVYTRGDTAFFGMSSATGSPELYLIDIAHPRAIAAVRSKVIGSTILGMFARDSVLFMLASTIQQFQMLDISSPTSTPPYAPAIALPGTGASLDCEGNYFFVASNTASQGNLSIIGPHL